MNRRAFFKLAAAAAIPVGVGKSGAENAEKDWWESVEETLQADIRSEEGKLRLQVQLFKPEAIEVVPSTSRDGEVTRFKHKGVLLPVDFWPGRNLLRKFRFTWDDREIPIPERFWNDLTGFQIQTSTLTPEQISQDLRWKFEEYVALLLRPRVTLSDDGGTALIEWERSEECDRRSTIRWMVSRGGVVMRHRHAPPCTC